jgi:hypothetical protein
MSDRHTNTTINLLCSIEDIHATHTQKPLITAMSTLGQQIKVLVTGFGVRSPFPSLR